MKRNTEICVSISAEEALMLKQDIDDLVINNALMKNDGFYLVINEAGVLIV